jgi:membrane protease YdiL (CAAX protease family)
MMIAAPTSEAERVPISGAVFQAVITFWVTVLLLAVGFLIYRGQNPVRLFGLRPANWQRCLGVGLLGIAGIFPVILLMQKLLFGWFPEAVGDRTVEFLRTTATSGDWLAVVLMAAVVAPLAEEIFFRGYLYGVVRRYGGRWAAIGVTALLFAAIHGNAVGFAPLVLLGVVFAVAYELTGSLWTNILMHAVFNGTTLAMLAFFPGVDL